MQKTFTTFIQQIDLLKKEKKIVIADTAYAEDIIKRTGYFPLMGGICVHLCPIIFRKSMANHKLPIWI